MAIPTYMYTGVCIGGPADKSIRTHDKPVLAVIENTPDGIVDHQYRFSRVLSSNEQGVWMHKSISSQIAASRLLHAYSKGEK